MEIKITMAMAISEKIIVNKGKDKFRYLSNLKPPNTPNKKTASIWKARFEYLK